MGSSVIEILRRKEKQARLKFWRMLLQMSGQTAIECPFKDELPPGAVHFGMMPENMRGAFIQAYRLRSEERRAEAEIFEEAISDLMQEHFRKMIEEKAMQGEKRIGQFRLGKEWAVYAIPLE